MNFQQGTNVYGNIVLTGRKERRGADWREVVSGFDIVLGNVKT
jgi:hypothetical protein